jgi:hypothetical protein
MRRFIQGPNERIAYTFDWNPSDSNYPWLQSSLTLNVVTWTIVSVPSTVEPTPALTKPAESNGATTATVELATPTEGVLYRVTCKATTNENDEIGERSFEISGEQR